MDKQTLITTATQLPVEIREKLDRWADEEARSTSAQIAMIIRKALEQHEREQPAPSKAQRKAA